MQQANFKAIYKKKKTKSLFFYSVFFFLKHFNFRNITLYFLILNISSLTDEALMAEIRILDNLKSVVKILLFD